MPMNRILVADDDLTFRSIMLKVLSDHGFEAVGVANGNEVLEAIKQGAFNVLVTDLMMPDMDGLEVIRHVTKTNPEVAIIAVSGGSHTGVNYIKTAKKFGADEIMAKPVNYDEFVAIVKKCCQTARPSGPG